MAANITTTVLRSSKGPVVRSGDLVGVLYAGNLIDADKTQFDANYDFTTFSAVPGRDLFTFTLGSGSVIAGWDQGLTGRRLGEVLELTIPAELAYGSAGAPPRIPADAPLQFKVELVGARPQGETKAIYPDLADLGVSKKEIKLLQSAKTKTSSSKVGTGLDDSIIGGPNADLIIGLGGSDSITGGPSGDVLIAGSGNNQFIYTDINESAARNKQRDQIIGFNRKTDTIDLSSIADNLHFIGKKSFSKTAGEVSFLNGSLLLDSNGNGKSDFEIVMLGTKQIGSNNLIF